MPCIQRVQASGGRRGLLSVGDCTMASRATRALSAGQGDFSLGPLPQVQRAAGELAAALEAVWSGEQARSPVLRERHEGQPERMAEGYDSQVPMSLEMAGELQSWTERRLGVRSVRQAQAAARALRARVAKALAQIEACNHRGRGKKRFDAVSA